MFANPLSLGQRRKVLAHRRQNAQVDPMKKVDVIAAIKKREPEFRSHGVTHVFLFGSVARGDEGPDSDVDMFFDHDIKDFDLFDYSGLKILASELLPFSIDFLNRRSIIPQILANAEADAIQVF